MKRQWSSEELIVGWTLTPADFAIMGNKTGATRLGFAVFPTYVQHEGRFPRGRQDVPWIVVTFLAGQVKVNPDEWHAYRWDSRTTKFHRTQIRSHLEFREATVKDGDDLTLWLLTEEVPQEQRPDHLRERLLRHCQTYMKH